MDVQKSFGEFFDQDRSFGRPNATTTDVINAVKKAFPNSTMVRLQNKRF